MSKKKDRDDYESDDYSTPAPTAEPTVTGNLPAEDYLREQEKLGPDPTEPAVPPEPAEILDIPKNQPYPTADSV